MGKRNVVLQASGAKTCYSQSFTTNVWGGKVSTFTVPAGVSQIKLSAVAVGGCLAGSATTMGMDGAANNVIFARLNGTDPAFVSFVQSTSDYLKIGLSGKYVYGSIQNSAAAGINGSGDISAPYRAAFFNPSDAIPWGLTVSQWASANQVISATRDGFNFTHTPITTSASPNLYSVVFGGNGQAMVNIGNDTNGSNLWFTRDYGVTWVKLSGAFTATDIQRLRYLNGYWIALPQSGTAFAYTATPLSASGAVNTWSMSAAFTATVKDIGWTGTTAVLVYSNATNVQISPWAAGAAPSSAWTLQAHGGDLAFDTCETAPTGEVMLFRDGTGTTSATSVRATSGAATAYTSVNIFGSAIGGHVLNYEAFKYMPFTGGGMWIASSGNNGNTASFSAAGAAITVTATSSAIAGNPLTNATAVNNLQWLGGNYCSLASTNGLGKYSSAGVFTASLSTAAQLTAEFGYTSTVSWSPSFSIARNGTNVLTLQGGGTSTATLSGAGGGFQYPGQGYSGANPGQGPTGTGGQSNGTVANIIKPTGNGGDASYVANNIYGGGGTWQFQSAQYAPMPNSIIPGASGAALNSAGIINGGGGSLFSPPGACSSNGPTYDIPTNIYASSQRVGSYGGGANGCPILSATYRSAAGGAQGCYKLEIACYPGDVFTLTLPGCCYVYANGTTGTNGGPGGESYAMIEYNV